MSGYGGPDSWNNIGVNPFDVIYGKLKNRADGNRKKSGKAAGAPTNEPQPDPKPQTPRPRFGKTTREPRTYIPGSRGNSLAENSQHASQTQSAAEALQVGIANKISPPEAFGRHAGSRDMRAVGPTSNAMGRHAKAGRHAGPQASGPSGSGLGRHARPE